MLQQLPVRWRGEAAESMSFEANRRVEHPIYGCAGIITQLQHQIVQAQQELAKVQAEIAYYKTPRQLQDDSKIEQSYDFHADTSWLITDQNQLLQQQKQQSTMQASNSIPGYIEPMGGEYDGSHW
ncbi:hypothetical protein Ancab_007197 [Ancistrocladus abbreviatus]